MGQSESPPSSVGNPDQKGAIAYASAPRRSFISRQADVWVNFFGRVGQVTDMTWGTLRAMFRRPIEWRAFIDQLEALGVASLGIVAVTSLFIGMVMSVQFAFGYANSGAWSTLGALWA